MKNKNRPKKNTSKQNETLNPEGRTPAFRRPTLEFDSSVWPMPNRPHDLQEFINKLTGPIYCPAG